MTAKPQYRHVEFKTDGHAASDGAGVQLTRMIGTPQLPDLDPFLMLDFFESTNPDDYIAGFPPHPHRGFETVTYLLAGNMRHKDNQGHEGIIKSGGVQWMTAGRGIIHSEMPEQQNGLLKGFQLWVNLPAESKMVSPYYQEVSSDKIPVENRPGSSIKVITGSTQKKTVGPVENQYIQPLMLDIKLDKNEVFTEAVPETDNTFVVVISGEIEIKGDQDNNRIVLQNELAVLKEGNTISVSALEDNTQFLMVSAQPIKEPIARGGPFVMNTQEEIEQAFSDYKNGRF